MNVEAYLARIGYEGRLEPTLTTLQNLHRAHLFAVPYENLDIHLGQPLTLELPQIFDKLVTQKRGGWCFEMNGLFAWALRELGFTVTLLGAKVERTGKLPRDTPDHLTLAVTLDRIYLADVGFGDGLLEPLPLEVGRYRQGFLEYTLAHLEEHWVFQNQPYGAAPKISFTLEPYQLKDFAKMSYFLQTSPESGFVRAVVSTRFISEGYTDLRGATLRTVTGAGVEERVLESAADFDAVLRNVFGLELPRAAELWPLVSRQHAAWLEQMREQRR